MHTVKVNFEFSKMENLEQITEQINLLLGAWRMNGQILGKQFPIAKTKNGLECFVNTPESASLPETEANEYVSKSIAGISENKDLVLRITVLGDDPESATLCSCKEIKSYIL